MGQDTPNPLVLSPSKDLPTVRRASPKPVILRSVPEASEKNLVAPSSPV